MTQEEKGYLDGAAAARHQLAQETVLCDHMITLVELAQKRRRAAIDAGRMAEDTCGYDDRLDTISARDAFAAYIRSPAGEAMLTEQHLAPPPRRSDSDASKQGAEGEADDAEMSEEDDDATRGMCLRKRCKAHSGWQKMLVLGVKYQIRELAEQAAEVSDQERVVKEAAAERRRRKQSESNWVEVIE